MFGRLAAAQEAAAQHRAGRDWSSITAMGGPSQPGANVEKAAPGPSSLFVFGENNPIRRYTRFIIEWPYPLMHSHFKIYDHTCRLISDFISPTYAYVVRMSIRITRKLFRSDYSRIRRDCWIELISRDRDGFVSGLFNR